MLLGQIANTNAQHISRAFADIGVNVFFHTVVGDNLERAAGAIQSALDRSDVVVVTGGLGPTPDDLTRDTVARVLRVPLERDDRLVRQVREVFESRGREMPEDNLKQADLPTGATPIEPQGTAPGFWIESDGRLLFALPGVPWEMRAMLDDVVLPLLRERAGPATIATREIWVIGPGESATHEKIRDLVAAQTNPTIAFLAGRGQVRVRVTARAADRDEALRMIEPVEQQIRARLGDDAVPGSPPSLADALARLVRERRLRLAVAESLTGGLIGAELTRAKGATDFFLGSLVCYTNEAKHALAGVARATLEGPGPVSREAAAELARGAARALDADLGISATGLAGPEPRDGMPVGTTFVGASLRDRIEVRHIRGYGDRENIRALSVTAALDLARRVVQRS